ncbi:methyltransferase domain-containing protein [Actinomadura viridis]|uniref:SAM-dependent methyltransferase n=1 Tax=Actinomadura viridis TaxID=58110 RepID=A0A931GI00_9ACTN|nr:methyltransferase domain-containing protein [Actinomadura viridis]MBG6087467.1 SAM-dependent methyltransferase [Actinomadura viridis]
MPARPPEPSIANLRDAPGDDESLALYWRFYWAVAAAQLARWLPRRPSRILDLAGGTARSGAQAAAAGHDVIEVLDPHLGRRRPGVPTRASRPGGNGVLATKSHILPAEFGAAAPRPGENGSARHAGAAGPAPVPGTAPFTGTGPGTGPAAAPVAAAPARRVIADSGALGFLTDACVDAVIAENRVLSHHLVTEAAVAEIARVLKPGGRVLLSVDSLTLGMALLAEQNCWAHLSDVPSAEVLLVPWPDGTITRCFWADQLRELLTDAGLEVEWIRPRTALSPSTVEHVLATSPRALPRLVRTELSAPLNDDSLGVHLLASARRRGH